MERPWFWEGRVQAALALALEEAGWQVTEVADTETKAPGIDLLATMGERWLAIEVRATRTRLTSTVPSVSSQSPHTHRTRRGSGSPMRCWA